MDTLFWTQYNPDIALEHTLKKYYGKYLYKIVLYAPAGRLIEHKGTIQEGVDHRMRLVSSVTSSHFYWSRISKDLDKADVLFLEKLKTLRQDKSLNIKMRVEEPRIQIYATTEIELQNLVIDHFQLFPKTYVTSFSGPVDADAEALLNSGAIIRKKDSGYKYKIILKDGKYPIGAKQQILGYLLNLGENEVMLPKSGFDMLNKLSSGYIWNLYFYVNDPAITTFLNLMYPGIVSNMHELAVLDNK